MDAQRENGRMRFISFSGIDGAGKSTQIERLCATLGQTGVRVRLICFWDHVAVLARIREALGYAVFRGDAGVGTPSAPVRKRDKNVRSRIMTAIRLCLYLADAISLRVLMKRALRSDIDVLIFDRFIYDELANLELHQPLMRAYARAIARIVPKPDISYLLDADPIAARERKPEYPLDFLAFNRKAYLTLSDFLGGIHVIAPSTVDDMEQVILTLAIGRLSLAPVQPRETLGIETSCVR